MRAIRFHRLLLVAFLTPFLSACDETAVSEVGPAVSLNVALAEVGISGVWSLNVEESQLPRRARDGQHRHRGRRAGPRGDLSISIDGATVTLGHGGRGAHTLTADGQTRVIEGPRGEFEMTAWVEGEALVIERSLRNDGTMARRFELSADGEKLIVTNRLEVPSRDRSGEFRVVFDRSG